MIAARRNPRSRPAELGGLGERACRLSDPEPAARRLHAAWRHGTRGGIAIGDMILDLAARSRGWAFRRRARGAAEADRVGSLNRSLR